MSLNIKAFQFIIEEAPAFFHQKRLLHLWNAPEFCNYNKKFILDFLFQRLKQSGIVIDVYELLVGDKKYWNIFVIKNPSIKPFLHVFKQKDKQLVKIQINYYWVDPNYVFSTKVYEWHTNQSISYLINQKQ